MNTQNDTSFKNALLSVLVISVITGAYIPWENYLPRAETPAMKAMFENRNTHLDEIVTHSMVNIDTENLARLAEDNLIAEIDAEIDRQVRRNAQAFAEIVASPEADEPYDYALEQEQFREDDIDVTPSTQIYELPSEFMIEASLLFAFDSSEINATYYQTLNETALFMQDESQQKGTVWQVVGYADLTGSALYNQALAKQRAQNVAAYLVDKGVEEAHISIVSLGASEPLYRDRSVENNRHERRVEIHAYQAEVTALAEQYNQQLTQQRSVHAKQQEAKRTASLSTQPMTIDIVDTPIAEMVLEKQPTTRHREQMIGAERLITTMKI